MNHILKLQARAGSIGYEVLLDPVRVGNRLVGTRIGHVVKWRERDGSSCWVAQYSGYELPWQPGEDYHRVLPGRWPTPRAALAELEADRDFRLLHSGA